MTKKQKADADDALVTLVNTGSVQAAERALMRNFKLTSREMAEDLVGDAALHMVAAAPAEIRGSFEMVVSWHRWNEVYQRARRANDAKAMIEAQKGLDTILRKVH